MTIIHCIFQEGKTATDVADVATKPVLTGEYKKEDLLEASRSGNEEKLMSLLTPLNVNCHASDGRKSTPLHLAAGYNRTRIGRCLSFSNGNIYFDKYFEKFDLKKKTI